MSTRAYSPTSTARARAGAPVSSAAGLAALAAVVALAGCEPYVEGNGVAGEELRTVTAFSGLSLSDGIQASVTAGAERSVLVRGDENVLKYVETLVLDRPPFGPVLVVRAASAYASKHPVQVIVSTPALDYVSAVEASPVGVTGAAADLFTVEASDGSSVLLAGAGGARLVLTLSGGQHGGGRLDARGYPVAAATATLTDGAIAQLQAAGPVDGTAAGAGTRLENSGGGACSVTASDGAQVVCPAP